VQTWPFVDVSLNGVWQRQRQLEPDPENCAAEDSPVTARLKEDATVCQSRALNSKFEMGERAFHAVRDLRFQSSWVV